MVVNAAHPLGALIDKAKSVNDWSDVDVARRAKGRGHTISKSNIARIRTEPVTTIVGKQLFALSEGLGIPVQRLAFAALESMGIASYETSAADAEQAVRLDATLPEHVRRTLLTIILNERDRYGRSDAEEEQEPRTQESSPQYSSAGGGTRRPGAPMTVVTAEVTQQSWSADDPDGPLPT